MDDLVFVSKVVRLPLLEASGSSIGSIVDVIVVPSGPDGPPRVLGFVVSVQRRRIFVGATRVGELTSLGVRLRSGTVDLRHFRRRRGELLLAEAVLRHRAGDHVVTDVGIGPSSRTARGWEVAVVALRTPGGRIRRRATTVVPWTAAGALFDPDPIAAEVAQLRDLADYDLAQAVRALPGPRRHELTEALEDERLADLLEELPEPEQVEILAELDPDRAAAVLAEMEPDDAADLLGELPPEVQQALLAAMAPGEADDLRRLLLYSQDTAGGLMTSEPVVLTPATTIAEALARVREQDLPPALAAQVFVSQPPTDAPTGPYLGAIGFQRLLREPPGVALGTCIDDTTTVTPDLPDTEVARRLAAYDLIAVAVCDENGSLLGAVTVDDVLDRVLPPGWRTKRAG